MNGREFCHVLRREACLILQVFFFGSIVRYLILIVMIQAYTFSLREVMESLEKNEYPPTCMKQFPCHQQTSLQLCQIGVGSQLHSQCMSLIIKVPRPEAG